MRFKKKIVIIGLDGGAWYILDKFIRAGDIPNLDKIVAEGGRSPLLSTYPPITAPAWTTMRTGVNPGKHSIFGFTQPSFGKGNSIKGRDVLLVDARAIRAPSLWRILSNYDERVGVFNVPFTYPVEKVNGVLIAGSMTGGEQAQSYPEDCIAEIVAKTGTRYFERAVEDGISQSDGYVRHLINTVREQRKIDRYLLQHYDFGFYKTVYTQTDPLQHMFLKYIDENHPGYVLPSKSMGDLIRELYHEIDISIGMITQLAGNDALILIVSDHGFQPAARRFYVNNLLFQRGSLAVHQRGNSRHSSFAQKLINTAGAIGAHRLLRLLSYDRRRKLKRALSSATTFSIDYGRTRLFADSNQMGIYSMPGVEVSEIWEVQSQLSELREGKDYVFESVKLGRDVYSGPFTTSGPDLVFLPKAPYEVRADLTGRVLFEDQPIYAQNGTHSFEGILTSNQRGVKIDAARRIPELVDIAPTVLYAMGYPIPDYMDGRVIDELFPSDWLTRYPVRRSDAIDVKSQEEAGSADLYSDEEAEIIHQRLADLGYL